MKAGVLFSGGKDSALAALLLSRDYSVELNTFVFSHRRETAAVKDAAAALGFPWRKQVFKDGLLQDAVNMVISSGYPNDAIQMVHRQALLALATGYGVIADGTRFNDRVPMLTRDEVQSLQDTCGCAYIRPLLGYPRAEVDRLAGKYLRIACGETGRIGNGDYEGEIREAIHSRGIRPGDFFPQYHEQSLVLGRVHPERVKMI